MIREMFHGKLPSHFQINPVIKAFILAEMMVWSAWNSIIPIFALFAAQIGGTIEIAATAYSAYLLTRVLFELISGRILTDTGDMKKFLLTILGFLIVSLGYIGFAFTTTVLPLYLFYAVIGMGMGLASPAKNSLFSMHLDKNKESMEWGITDASVFFSMALAAALGGFIAKGFGFQTLFLLAGFLNMCSVLPYLLYIRRERKGFFYTLIFKHSHEDTESSHSSLKY